MMFIILTITIVGTIAIILLATRWIMKRRTTEDVEETKARRYNELAFAAESLELIANDIDEWVKQQKDRIMPASVTFQKKWISRWFSDFFIMELFENKVHKKHFGDIVDTLRLYMPDIAESLKELRHNFLNCTKFMRQIQNVKHKAEDNHDLGYWCGNFLDKTARPTAKSLRRLSEQTRKHLTDQKQVKKKEERTEEVIDNQVDKLTAQKQAKKKEEQPKEEIDKQVGKHTAQEQVKKKEERPQELLWAKLQAQKQAKKKAKRPEETLDKQVGESIAQKQVKKKEERTEEVIDNQVDNLTAQKQAEKKKERPQKKPDNQVGKLTAQKQGKTEEGRPEKKPDNQVGKLTAQKQGKTEEDRPEKKPDNQVGKLIAQKQVKPEEGRPEKKPGKQVDKLTPQKQAKKKKKRPQKKPDNQAGKLTAQKQTKTEEDRPEGVLNKQVGILLESSPDITAFEIAKMINKNYAGVYKPISPYLVVKTESWKKYLEKVTVGG
jgi:hypothetical protein